MEMIKIGKETIIPYHQLVSIDYDSFENETVVMLKDSSPLKFNGNILPHVAFININGSEISEFHL